VAFVSTASNPWELFWVLNYDLAVRSYWIGFLAAVLATAAFVFHFARRDLTASQILVAALLSTMMLPFLLPGMHERYFALAELLAFSGALILKSPSAVAIAILMQIQFILSFFGWSWTMPALTIVGSALTLIALALLLRTLTRRDRGNVLALP
jgi:glucose-6-phosphate-specific signal transduction histidine kinase